MSEVLTPAEKAKVTRALNMAKERREQAAFEAQSKLEGGRKAKKAANANPLWLVKELDNDPKDRTQLKRGTNTAETQPQHQTVGRKRTSSTAAVAEKPKKAKESEPADIEPQPSLKTKTKTKANASRSVAVRRHAAPAISIDTDDENDTQSKRKSVKAPKAITAVTKISTDSAVKPAAPIKPARLVVESDSESRSSDDEDNESDTAPPDAEEFAMEAPRIIGQAAVFDDEDDEPMPDAPPRRAPAPEDLFEDSVEVTEDDPQVVQALERAAALKAKNGSLTDDDIFSDLEYHEETAKPTRFVEPRSRRSSTGSWSSGQELTVPLTDDDESGDEEGAAVKIKGKKKVTAARQKKADLERPKVRPAAQVKPEVHAAQAVAPSRPESDYHEAARLVLPPPGKDVRMNDQSDVCKLVLRNAIVLLKGTLFFDDAYAQILSRTGFGKGYLIQAAEELGGEALHIKARLTTDAKYTGVLAGLLVDRVNIIRGAVKKVAVNFAPGLYKILGLDATATQKQVEELLSDHRYIFGVDSRVSRIKGDEPFLHPAIIAVLKQAILTNIFKAQHEHRFKSTNHEHPDRLELPDAMVALAATAVYASLVEYRTTGERQAINFTEAAYEDTYRNHVKTLADTRTYAPIATHRLLHRLYQEAVDARATQPSAGSSSALINLIDIPGEGY